MQLVARVYPDLLSNYRNISWLSERCIVAPLNETTRAIIGALVAQLPGDFVEYRSLDSVPDESQAVHFPTEFLNSLEVSGFSCHLLSLKVASPIFILQSLDPPKVTNGTRCVFTQTLYRQGFPMVRMQVRTSLFHAFPCSHLTQHCLLSLDGFAFL